MKAEDQITRLAILRTMGSLHTEPLQYDLANLHELVITIAPDLLCADITLESWESGDLAASSIEIQEALAPAISLTQTVLIPIAPTARHFSDYQAPPGIRKWLSNFFEKTLLWGQRLANRSEAIHGLGFQVFCHTVCALEEMTWSPADHAAYTARTRALAANIIKAVQRDPGGRILVVVQCQWHHRLEPLLKNESSWIKIVDYQEL